MEKVREKFGFLGLWKEEKLSTQGCGKKEGIHLEKIGVIHINFPYCDCYYQKYIWIYISISYSRERKFFHALYL